MRWLLLICALPAAALAEPDAGKLAWLEGRWTGAKDGVASEETWSSAGGGALLGMHKDVKAGRMVSWEFFRVDAGKEGKLVYFASPRSAPPVPFTATEISDHKVTFANEAHDFPQRLRYWLDDAGALHARIEGKLGGKPASEEWVWTRAR